MMIEFIIEERKAQLKTQYQITPVLSFCWAISLSCLMACAHDGKYGSQDIQLEYFITSNGVGTAKLSVIGCEGHASPDMKPEEFTIYLGKGIVTPAYDHAKHLIESVMKDTLKETTVTLAAHNICQKHLDFDPLYMTSFPWLPIAELEEQQWLIDMVFSGKIDDLKSAFRFIALEQDIIVARANGQLSVQILPCNGDYPAMVHINYKGRLVNTNAPIQDHEKSVMQWDAHAMKSKGIQFTLADPWPN